MLGHAGLILVVDDDPDFSGAIASYLETHDYVVLEAYGDREGLSLARKERPDLIIVGATTTAKTEEKHTIEEIRRVPDLGDVPILLVQSIHNGQAGPSVPARRDSERHVDWLARPLRMPELLVRIRERLATGPILTGIPTEGSPQK